MPHLAKDKRQYSPGDIYKTQFLTSLCSGICSVKSQWVKFHSFLLWQNNFSHYINSKNYFQCRFIYLFYFQEFVKVVLKQQLIFAAFSSAFFNLLFFENYWLLKYPASVCIYWCRCITSIIEESIKKQSCNNQLSKNSDFCLIETVNKLFTVRYISGLLLLLLLFCFSLGFYCHNTLRYSTNMQSGPCFASCPKVERCLAIKRYWNCQKHQIETKTTNIEW